MTTSFQLDYDYLRPPASAKQIIHEESYKFKKTPARRIRRLFYKATFDEVEEQKISEFEEMLKKENLTLPPWWNRQECLRWCYSKRLELPQSLTLFKNYLNWSQDPKVQTLSPEGLSALKQGVVYQLGRDSKMRPIMIVDVRKIIDLKIEVDDFLNAMVHVLELIRTRMSLPGHVEQNIVIIETDEISLFKVPMGHLKGIIQTASNNYPECLAKMYILNPSFILRTSWNLIKSFMEPETAEKISSLRRDEFDQMQELIPVDQLEEKFGGTLPNLTEFWPPRLTVPADQIVWNNCQFETGRWDPNFNYKVRKNKKIPNGLNICQTVAVHQPEDIMNLQKSHSDLSEEHKDVPSPAPVMKESFMDCLSSGQFPRENGLNEEQGADVSMYYSARGGGEPSVIIEKQEADEEDIPELVPDKKGRIDWVNSPGIKIPQSALMKINKRQIALEAPDNSNGFCGCNRPDDRPAEEEESPQPEIDESPPSPTHGKEECVLI